MILILNQITTKKTPQALSSFVRNFMILQRLLRNSFNFTFTKHIPYINFAHVMQKTTLYDEHVKLGAKMVPFAGFLMPIKYSGELIEHKNVREHAGIFDVSHMGEIEIIGKDALLFCQKITCNDVSKLTPGKIQYTVLCNEQGGAVDDCTLYMFSENHYMFCVNASNIEKNFSFMNAQKFGSVEIVNKSTDYDLL